MFHENMCFILESPDEARELGRMLSEEGILWVGGDDPANKQFFFRPCTFWFIKEQRNNVLAVLYLECSGHSFEFCFNYAREAGYEHPIWFCEWAHIPMRATPDNIDDLI